MSARRAPDRRAPGQSMCAALRLGGDDADHAVEVDAYRGLTRRPPASGWGLGSGYRLVGDLPLHGVQREVTLEAEFAGVAKDAGGNERANFSATTVLDRRDYGLVWDSALETGGIVVGEQVRVAINSKLSRRSPRPPRRPSRNLSWADRPIGLDLRQDALDPVWIPPASRYARRTPRQRPPSAVHAALCEGIY